MGQRHKHADVIIAWAEGAEVECRARPDRPWTPMTNRSSWYDYEGVEYRIKPITEKYRVALLLNDDSEPYTISVNSQYYANSIEQQKDFIRWLTDWIKYEE